MVIVASWAILARALAPPANTSASRFDVIIVLGADLDSDGNPTPTLQSRIAEGVREYERGVAPRLIMTGASVRRHQEPQAKVMARVAEAQGVPASAILVEPAATDTIENACYSARIMKQHGWRSVEIVSSPTHLARAGIIFSKLPLTWRVHAAPPLEPQSSLKVDAAATLEVLKTARYLVYANWAERCSP